MIPVRPSPIFIGLVGATAAVAVLLASGGNLDGKGIFVLVLLGWVVSLTLHEFGHAVVAYVGGDHSVVAKGYLGLDVRKYADPFTSLILPIAILFIGGIGLPGGAVWINHSLIRSTTMRSLVSAAGPAMTLLCAFACLLPVRAGMVSGDLEIALAFLGWIQVIAFVLNMLPIPGLDGFGILEPYLSPQTRRSLAPVRQYGFFLLIAALWWVDPVADAFWGFTDSLSETIGGDAIARLRSAGWRAFRFWE